MRPQIDYFYKLFFRKLHLLIISISVFFILNIYLNTGVPARDSGIFLYIGSLILDGQIPFLDAWESKPPLIFYTNALALLFGRHSLWSLWIIEYIFLFCATTLNYKLLKKLFGKTASIFGTAVFLVMFGKLIQGGNQIEEYTLLLQVICLYIFFNIQQSKKGFTSLFFVGVISGIMFLFKPNILGIVLSISILTLLESITSKNWSLSIRKILFIVTGFSLSLGVVALYFISKKALFPFIDQAFYYNLIYSNTAIKQKAISITTFFKIFPAYSAIIISSYVLGFIHLLKNRSNVPRIIALNTLALPLGLILSGISGRSYYHYYISLLPVSALLIGQFIFLSKSYFNSFMKLPRAHGSTVLTILSLSKDARGIFSPRFVGSKIPSKQKTLRIAYSTEGFGKTSVCGFLRRGMNKYFKSNLNIGLVITILIAGPPIIKDMIPIVSKNLSLNYRLMGKDLKLRTFRFNNFAEHQDTIDVIEQNTNEKDYVLIYGAEPALNFITKRDSPSKYFYQYPLYTFNYTSVEMFDNFINDVRSKNTKLIIDASLSTADIEAGEGYIIAPINLNERQEWYKTNKNTGLFNKYEEFFDYIDSDYEAIASTYHGKWTVYKKK